MKDLLLSPTEEREVRLHQMSVRQSERLAAESQEEREARLQSTESTEEREARLQLMSEERLAQERIRERASSSQLFKQNSVQKKIRTFHAHYSSLHAPCTAVSW